MKHFGDITKINGAAVPPVDCITFGSPCQDLSLAGKRAGLAGARSGLFMEAVRIIKEMRGNDGASGRSNELVRPRYAVWENVPGAFSSNRGEDFRAVLEELVRIKQPDAVIPGPPRGKWTKAGAIAGDGWSLAWRTLDAQYWGVPQRRRRIALVVDFGGESAGEVLFERESLPGHPHKSVTPWQGIARNPADGVAGYDRVVGQAAYRIGAYYSEGMKSANPTAGIYQTEKSCTLDANGGNPSSQQGGIVIAEELAYTLKIRSGCEGGGKGALVQTEKSATLSTLQDQTLFVPTGHPVPRWIARRLTPVECERLQGYPDGWTDIGEWVDSKGKRRKYADAPRYKALGNSIALPQWWWLTCKMADYLPERATLASLFDGIGGFPLVWETRHGKGTALWASEIEDFPIAVTKIRFPEEETP